MYYQKNNQQQQQNDNNNNIDENQQQQQQQYFKDSNGMMNISTQSLPTYQEIQNNNVNNQQFNNNTINYGNAEMFSSVIINPLKTSQTFRTSSFITPPSHAINAYEQWKQNLWFTPTGFKKQLPTDTLEKIYIPCYSFNVTYRVYFQGIVHYCPTLTIPGTKSPTKGKDNTSTTSTTGIGEHIEKHEGHSKKSVEDGYITKSLNKILLCALATGGDYHIGFGSGEDSTEIKISYDFHKSTEHHTDEAFRNQCAIQNIRICDHMNKEDVWRTYRDNIELIEQDRASKYLAEQEQSPYVGNVTSKVLFEDIKAMLYYVPYYHAQFIFNGHSYSFLVNGQNGQVISTRPQFGLGKLGDVVKGVKNYVSTVFGDTEQGIRIMGADLATDDDAHVYEVEHVYLTWPRSATRLMWGYATGWVTVRNTSNQYHVSFRAQKRRGFEKGNQITLAPSQEETYSYKGHWCIELLDNANSLYIQIMSHSIVGGDSLPSVTNKANFIPDR